MGAVLFLSLYLLCGCAVIRFVLPEQPPLIRLWLGLCLGFMLFMWLPSLCAFLARFTLAAHYLSLIPLGGITFGAYLLRNRARPRGWPPGGLRPYFAPMALLIVFGALSYYMQYTHTFREAMDGSLHVGQSTYGDLPMHAGFVTGFIGAPFPPQYPMMKGELLCYPFLMDALSASLYLGGFSLQAALIVPGVMMMLLLYFGVYALAESFTGSRKAAVLAFLLIFLNGGLGFLYTFDLAPAANIPERLHEVLNGFYKTPTNQPVPNNLRWSNLICDLLIPQRTLLAGYTQLIPCLYLLTTGNKTPRRMLLLGLWAGALPMVHTHSFLALGLFSAGFMLYEAFHKKDTLIQTLKPFLLYGAAAVLLAAPQLVGWTFKQSSATDRFITFHFNWVNNTGSGLIDSYFWFYFKNIGLPLLFILMALTERNARYRKLLSGAFCIFIAAELVRFQPNAYDNYKLFYVWYMLCILVAADYARKLWRALKRFRGRYLLAAAAAALLFTSAALTVWREAVSDYTAFDSGAVAVAAYAREQTAPQDTFLTGTQHLNPVMVLGGRTVPVSSDSWLYFHGLNTGERRADVRRFYEDPESHKDMLSKYDIRYIYVSPYERAEFDVDERALERAYALVYNRDRHRIYRVGPP